MAIWIGNEYKLAVMDSQKTSGELMLYPMFTIDLKSGKRQASNEVVLYGPQDLKKLARSQDLTFTECEKTYFVPVGTDDKNGARAYLARPQ